MLTSYKTTVIINIFFLFISCNLSLPPPPSNGYVEYCQSEFFNVTCDNKNNNINNNNNDHVILIEGALFGRMRSGRCVTGSYGHVGCWADVTSPMNRKCSGRSSCLLHAVDPLLNVAEPCPRDLSLYLEVKFLCVSVISSRKEVCQRSKKPQLISSGYISSLVSRQHGVGRKWCPWRLSVGEGRYVRLVLVSVWKKKSRIARQISTSFSASAFPFSSLSPTTSESFITPPTTPIIPETPNTQTTFSDTQTTPFKRIKRNAWYKNDVDEANVIKHGVPHVGSIKTNRLHHKKPMITNILQNYVIEPFSGFCQLVGVVLAYNNEAGDFVHENNENIKKNISTHDNNKNNKKINKNDEHFGAKEVKNSEMEGYLVTENKNNEVVLKLHICEEEEEDDDGDANKKMFFIDKENEKEPRIMKIINNNYKKNKNNNKNNNNKESLNKLLSNDIYLQVKHHHHNDPSLHHHTTHPPSHHHTITSHLITIILEDKPTLPDFLLHFQGIGCVIPEFAGFWVKREGFDRLVVGCGGGVSNVSEVGYLVCGEDGKWLGDLPDCSVLFANMQSNSLAVNMQDKPFPIGVLLLVSVGVALGVCVGGGVLSSVLLFAKRKPKINCPSNHLENPTHHDFYKPMPLSRGLLTSPSISGEEFKLTSDMNCIRKHDLYAETGINAFQDGDRCCSACGGQVSIKRKQFDNKNHENKDDNFMNGNTKVSSVSGCCLHSSSTLNSRFLPFPVVNDFCSFDTFTFHPFTSCHLPIKPYSLDTTAANSAVFQIADSAALQAANPAEDQALENVDESNIGNNNYSIQVLK